MPEGDRDEAMRAAAEAAAIRGGELRRATLRFADSRLESAYRRDLFADVIVSVRAAYVLAVATWAVWGLVFPQYAVESPQADLLVRFGVLIPIAFVALLVTALPIARRIWEAEAVVVVLLTALVWTVYVTVIASVPADLAYVGVILIMAFAYTLLRLRFVLVAVTGITMIGLYFAAVIALDGTGSRPTLLALFYLVSFYTLGLIASYTRERNSRLLFLRDRQLDRERRRSEALLLNVLPPPIATRLMARAETGAERPDGHRALADEHPEVAVLFADLAGFTEQAGLMRPDTLVATLDGLFSEMDVLTDRYGLEKIKTIGDAYMAVAGVPAEVSDPAGRAMEMALDLVRALEGRRWPSGDPLAIRVGIATGSVVAGVIGRRKFAYDVWGDTVNLASRLQGAAQPGCILVAERAAQQGGDRFIFGPLEVLELKGKGSQAARRLEGRAAI